MGFLRGGSMDEFLEQEEDQVQNLDLSLTDSGHTHSYKDVHIWGNGWSKVNAGVSHMATRRVDDDDHSDYDKWKVEETKTTDSHQSSIKLNQDNYRKGDETRPVNTKVLWIMRVW